MPLIVASFPTTRTQLTSIDPFTLPLTVLSLNVARPDEPDVLTATCSTEAPKLMVPLPLTDDSTATRCSGSEFQASAANATEISASDRPSIHPPSGVLQEAEYAKAIPATVFVRASSRSRLLRPPRGLLLCKRKSSRLKSCKALSSPLWY